VNFGSRSDSRTSSGQFGILAADCSKIDLTAFYFLSNASGNLSCTWNSGLQVVAGSVPNTLNTYPSLNLANTYLNLAAPSASAAGFTATWTDATNKVWSSKNDAGTISNTVAPSASVANQYMTGIGAAGVITRAQPSAADGRSCCPISDTAE
jgi:hypothetical protein